MKRCLFFILILLISAELKSQEKPLVIGISANPGISWIKPDNQQYQSEGSRFLFSYGLDFDFYFNSNYALSTGLQVMTYGGEMSYPDLYIPDSDTLHYKTRTTANYKYNSIHVPLYLKLKTNPIGYNSYFAEFGLSMLFPFKASQELTTVLPDQSTKTSGSENILDDTPFTSVNLLIGVGIELPFSGDTKFQLSLRYLNGLSSVSNANAYKTDENGNVSSDEISNGGQPTGDKQSYYLKNLSINFKIIF